MHIKTFPPLRVLSSIHKTTIAELHRFGPVMAELYAVAGRKSFINGPLHWIYYGMDGNPDTEFTLEIAIPIRKVIQSTKFEVRELGFFKAITFPHEGPWELLPGSHAQIMERLGEHNIPISNECREVFRNINFAEPEKNMTEIQIGVLPGKTANKPAQKKRLVPVYI
ncbi:GyrI-like domain-containing protein [Longitalea arenae]|uniref:GyrI-like domain-containing protein n=1 Tax=Longitalea arenae TaxID=2812558 RepID=UPI00196779EA|nr:GyrI-like domain-containing protein [Longitalea arenae]